MTKNEDKPRRHPIRKTLRLVSLGAMVAVVVKELRLPKEERTWHGDLAGVPYDLRKPTVSRIRAAYWDPENPRIFTPRVAGIGWGVNFGRLLRKGG